MVIEAARQECQIIRHFSVKKLDNLIRTPFFMLCERWSMLNFAMHL